MVKRHTKPWYQRCVYNQSFENPKTVTKFLHAELQTVIHTVKATRSAASQTDSYLRDLCQFPLLTRAGEQLLFNKMNAAKYKLNKALGTYVDYYHKIAIETRNLIASHNLRLVVSIAKKYLGRRSLNECVSDGNLSLLSAIDNFDVNRLNNYGRTNKFSTYASWAITLNFRRQHRDSLVATIPCSLTEDIPTATEQNYPEYDEFQALHKAFAELSPNQLAVIYRRYNLGGFSFNTLQKIGDDLELSKERVRQIQDAALTKLRVLLGGPKPRLHRKSVKAASI